MVVNIKFQNIVGGIFACSIVTSSAYQLSKKVDENTRGLKEVEKDMTDVKMEIADLKVFVGKEMADLKVCVVKELTDVAADIGRLDSKLDMQFSTIMSLIALGCS